MKAQRPYPQITITSKGEAALVGGHPWVYEGEVTGLSGPVSDGTPTTGSTGSSGGGASSTHGTIARPSWGRRIAAAAG